MKKLTQDDIEIRHAFADALEWADDNLPQGGGYLCNDDGFCCLGVACLFGVAKPFKEYSWVTGELRNPCMCQPFAGFDRDDMNNFTILNDDIGASFSEIADIVRMSCDEPDSSLRSLYYNILDDDSDDD